MLNKENCLLLVIDVQEKLVKMLTDEDARMITEKSAKIVNAAKILNIDTILTEQYPKGLGQTITAIREIPGFNYIPFEKTNFSAVKENEIINAIQKSGKKQVVIFGIETHICVFQTAVELKEMGYEVFAVFDISYSRSKNEKETAMQNLRSLSIQTPTLEMVLFSWLSGSKNPHFKEIQALIK